MKQKIKLFIILGVEILAVGIILLLVFFAGKKSYTVTFDLNGGTLISGELVQEVSQGKAATPPNVVKDGYYLHSWSSSYHQITRDITIRAVWEFNTTIGIDYISSEDSNYCEIVGCFPGLEGDVYIGAYHNGKKVLGIRDGAFKDCAGITKIHMLDGIVTIGNGAFEGCSSLETIELPHTITRIGDTAFKGCESLTDITLPDSVREIGSEAFAGCSSFTEIILPDSVQKIGAGAFDTENLTINLPFTEEDGIPEGFDPLWASDTATLVFATEDGDDDVTEDGE